MNCPICGSRKHTKIGKGATLIIMWLFASFFMFAGFLFFPLWIIAFLLLVASPVALFVKPTYICGECKHQYKVGATDAESNV